MENKKESIKFGEWLLNIGIVLNEPIRYRKFIGKEVKNVEDLYNIYLEQKKEQIKKTFSIYFNYELDMLSWFNKNNEIEIISINRTLNYWIVFYKAFNEVQNERL